MSDSTNSDVDNGTVDAVAATALIVLVILGAIHLICEGGLATFFSKMF